MNRKRIHGSVASLSVAALLLCAVLPSQVRGAGEASEEESAEQPAATHRDTIVVSANRVETEIRNVGSSVTVIDAEEIELRAKTSVAELLRSVPGVEVVRGGGPGQVTSVFIRGGNSSHTLVLIDGVRVNGPSTGAFDFANLSTDNVERIEIVRGPQSTLYGSEAMAGVISITSKRGREGLHFSGLAEAGELDHRRWSLTVDGGGDRFDYSVAVSDESTAGVSAARERAGNTENDAYELTSVSAALGFALGDDGRADLTLRTFDGRVGNDGFDFSAGPIDDLDRLQDREGLAASLRVQKRLGRRWNQIFLVGFNDDDLSGSDPSDLFSNFTVDSRSFELTAQSDVTVSDDDVLSFGVS
ncbi:MAG: TonB-dependent receptor plug domain-containing protein, partial [Thermoanaerobaculia bacterium]